MENYDKLNLDATYRVTLHKNLIEADFSKSLTLVEQRLLYAAISNIPAPIFKKENGQYVLDENGKRVIANPITELPKFKISVKEFSNLLGWKEVDYKKLAKVSGELMTKVITAKPIDNDDDLEQFQWVAYTRYIKGSGTVLIELHPRLLPFMANLTENFASVTLGEIMNFKSKYSARLFFLLKQWAKLGHKTMELDEIRKILGIGFTEKNGKRIYKLEKFYHFNQRALTPAIEEINKYTDLNISYEEITEGQRIIALNFIIGKKNTEQPKAPEKPKAPKTPKTSEKPNVYEELAGVFSILDFNEKATENVVKKLKPIKSISTKKKLIHNELKRLATYVLENENLGPGFVIKEVENAVLRLEETGNFDFNDLFNNSKPRGNKPANVKVEKVPDWFYKRQKNSQDQQPEPQPQERVDFEAERAKILAKLKAQ